MIVMHKNGFLLFFHYHILAWGYTLYILYTLYPFFIFRPVLAHHNKLQRRYTLNIL